MQFNNGWYEILHEPEKSSSHIHAEWEPRQIWCANTFIEGEWYMRNVVYGYMRDPANPTMKNIYTKTPLTWMFRRKEDAILFALRWI